jgi:hypothetical protein
MFMVAPCILELLVDYLLPINALNISIIELEAFKTVKY